MWAGALLGAGVHRWGGSWEVVVLAMGMKVVGAGLVCCAGGEGRLEEKREVGCGV
jgi:hypothetical protein